MPYWCPLPLSQAALPASRSLSLCTGGDPLYSMSAHTDVNGLVNLATSLRTPGCCEDRGSWHGDTSHSGSGVQCLAVGEETDVTMTFT